MTRFVCAYADTDGGSFYPVDDSSRSPLYASLSQQRALDLILKLSNKSTSFSDQVLKHVHSVVLIIGYGPSS